MVQSRPTVGEEGGRKGGREGGRELGEVIDSMSRGFPKVGYGNQFNENKNLNKNNKTKQR